MIAGGLLIARAEACIRRLQPGLRLELGRKPLARDHAEVYRDLPAAVFLSCRLGQSDPVGGETFVAQRISLSKEEGKAANNQRIVTSRLEAQRLDRPVRVG